MPDDKLRELEDRIMQRIGVLPDGQKSAVDYIEASNRHAVSEREEIIGTAGWLYDQFEELQSRVKRLERIRQAHRMTTAKKIGSAIAAAILIACIVAVCCG